MRFKLKYSYRELIFRHSGFMRVGVSVSARANELASKRIMNRGLDARI